MIRVVLTTMCRDTVKVEIHIGEFDPTDFLDFIRAYIAQERKCVTATHVCAILVGNMFNPITTHYAEGFDNDGQAEVTQQFILKGTHTQRVLTEG